MKKISVRSMLVAPKGKRLVAVDLSQAESWIVAHLSEDRNMQYSLNYSDIHSDTASTVVVDPNNYCVHSWQDLEDGSKRCNNCEMIMVKTARYIGKRYNHASGYRMKPPRAAQVINKDSDKPPYITVTIAESNLYSERWHKRYNVKGWWAEIDAKLDFNRTLITSYGRKRVFFGNLDDKLRKEATAFEPQSTIADHFNGAIHPELGIPGGLMLIRKELVSPYANERKIVNQSHDSCIIECPAGQETELAQEMKHRLARPLVIKNVEFIIPTDAEIGERWGELEKVA